MCRHGRDHGPAAEGRKECQACIDRDRELFVAEYNRCKEAGICVQSGCKKKATQYFVCDEHLEKSKVGSRKSKERARKLAKQNGLCVVTGCGKSAGGYASCEEHRRIERDRKRANYVSKKRAKE